VAVVPIARKERWAVGVCDDAIDVVIAKSPRRWRRAAWSWWSAVGWRVAREWKGHCAMVYRDVGSQEYSPLKLSQGALWQ
jgi:hypothetical protein